MKILCMLLIAVVAVHAATLRTRPPYIGCQDSSECGVGNCCVLGMGRFSIPMCQSVQEIHGSCRPYDEGSFNTSVYYPDGAEVELTNIHRLFCPCAPSLACDLYSSTCQDPEDVDKVIYNTVLV